MDVTKTPDFSIINKLLQQAGITINGNSPWDIQVHNDKFYARILKDNELGLGESYMDGWWDCPRIDLLIARLADAHLDNKLRLKPSLVFKLFLTKVLNFQTKKRALEVGKVHYDTGNELFQGMLDSDLNYTCAYWKNAENLDDAQQAKLELSCKKLQLEPGMRILDIGCGWGSFAKYAVEKYGVTVVGITISEQQRLLAQKRCENLPIEIRFQDYRDVHEKFDRIVSLGMFEHVGHLNYRKYMEVAHRCLVDDGIFLLHTIGRNESQTHVSLWLEKYIFPNGMLPSITQIGTAIENLFVMEDWHNFGLDYYKTLMAWHANFNKNWPQLKKDYDERFFRMWNYYLLYCAGGFITRVTQLWQIVLSKNGIRNRYEAAR